MTIQINKDWRIRKNNSDVYFLDEYYGKKWVCHTSSGVLSHLFVFYLRCELARVTVTTPADLISLLSKLQAEIEAAVKGEGE